MLFSRSPAAGHLASVAFRGRSYWQVLTRVAPVAGAIHGAFSLLFQGMGASRVALGSLVFTALWAVIYGLLRGRRNRLAVLLVWVAICGHSALATLVLGWDSGFHYYVLLMVPVMFVSPGRQNSTRVLLGLLLAVFYVALDVSARRTVPLEPIAAGALDWVRFFNMASTFFVLGYLAHVYFGVLRAVVRERDTVARWGGEEFLVVLPETGLEEAMRVAERARAAMEHGVWPDDRPVTMTLGVSQWRADETLAEAVARADEALYRGKHAGRNRSVLERPAVQPNSLPSSAARR